MIPFTAWCPRCYRLHVIKEVTPTPHSHRLFGNPAACIVTVQLACGHANNVVMPAERGEGE